MKKKELENLGYVLANPIRRLILQYLVNPQIHPKSFKEIQNRVSIDVGKKVTDGSINWYLTDLQAHGIITKEDRRYSVTPLGQNISSTIITLQES